MHILDIVENSVAAGAKKISILVEEDGKKNLLVIEIRDDGRGMDDRMRQKAVDPFVTTKSEKRVGMGLSLLSEAARRCGGEMTIDSKQGKGTAIRATFGLNHVDCQPMGDMVETMVAFVVGNPDVEFNFRFVRGGRDFSWSTGRIMEHFGNVPRYRPKIVDFIRTEMKEKFEGLE